MGHRYKIDDNVVQLDRESYEMLIKKIDIIFDYVSDKLEKYRERENERLVDISDISLYLRVSERTIYRRIKERKIAYNDDGGKYLFRIADIKEAVANNIIKTTKQRLNNLIDNHKTYSYARFNISSDE